MSAHTPGPWVYFSGSHSIYTADETRAIAISCGPRKYLTADEVETRTANERLIAAAPDLLAALVRLWEASEGNSDEEIGGRLHARAAITKATGAPHV